MSSSPVAGGRSIQHFETSNQARMQLVCFPHAGGSATYYFPFANALRPDLAVRSVQYPGRQDRRREPLVDSISRLADEIVPAFTLAGGIDADLPFAFFGHSMGALVAFEVARRLRRAALAGPAWLFVSGRRAPSRHRTGNIHLQDDATLLAELVRVGGTDPRFLSDPELVAAIVPVVRNDYRAVETYEYEPDDELTCPITALVGDADPQTTHEDASAWAEHTSGAFDLHVLPGGHFYLDAQRAAVIALIGDSLDRALDADLSAGRSL